MLSRQQLQRAASDSGFQVESLEKVWMLLRLLDMMRAHPFLAPRLVLKGGTALNLFVFDVPRLSVDIDVNYIGAPDRATMLAERPRLDAALQQVASRLGLTVKRAPDEHAGGKWRMSYRSALGRPAILEVDVNYLLRVPLWDPVQRHARELTPELAGVPTGTIALLDDHELAAGKLAALLARGASRDLFDARQLLASQVFDPHKLRVAFVVYGGINRVDWRTVSVESVTASVADVKRQLLPMLRHDLRPAPSEVDVWTHQLVQDTRALLGALLPLSETEVAFLERLNGHGQIDPSLLTADVDLRARIVASPGLRWKALNVRKHRGL